jgi:hypothetical protein
LVEVAKDNTDVNKLRRKQIDLILAANPKIEVDADYKALGDVVADEKGKIGKITAKRA